MGLAEPKKRRKISHDPRNLAWSSQASSTSYGHRLMTQQGWSEGQALGARDSSSSSTKKHKHHSGLATDAERLAAARVGVLFKDDNLGLGAKRKGGGSQNVEDQRTGLDAFQGLLGRLNGKGEDVLRQEEKKVEERRLEMFFKGRWGGMMFVRGGVLLGSDRLDGEKEADEEKKEDTEEGGDNEAARSQDVDEKDDKQEQEREEKRRRKEEKRQRKEERRKRREEKSVRKATQKVKSRRRIESESEDKDESTTDSTTHVAVLPLPSKHKSPITPTPAPDEPVSSPATSDIDVAGLTSTKRRRKSKSLSSSSSKTKARSQVATPTTSAKSVTATAAVSQPRNGRHLLRGRNIMAKKMVLSDAKGLDQIFMR